MRLARTSSRLPFSAKLPIQRWSPAQPLAIGVKADPRSAPERVSTEQAPSPRETDDPDARDAPAEQPQGWQAKLADLKAQMSGYGIAGVASYGLFNTLYYITVVCGFWFLAPGGVGGGGGDVAVSQTALTAATGVQKLGSVFAMTWVLSQATKLPRIGASLAFAPLVDRLLAWMAPYTPGKTKQQAFVVLTASCMLLAASVGGLLVLSS